MTQRDVIVRCPCCGNGKVISMAVGQLLHCDVCRTAFHAPIASDEELDSSVMTDSFEIVQPATGGQEPNSNPDAPDADTVAAEEPMHSDSPSSVDVGATHNEVPGRHTRSWRNVDIEIAPTQPASEETQSLTDSATTSPEPDSDEELDISEPSAMAWTILATFATGLILTIVVIAGFILVRKLSVARDNRADATSTPARGSSNGPQNPLPVQWTDAASASQRRGAITLKVERAIYGALRARDLAHQVITTEDNNLLGIIISVHNRGRRVRPFQNWYGHAFAPANSTDARALVAELTDDRGRSYTLLKFDDVSQIQGQRLADQIEPDDTVQDTVVFRIPEDVNRAEIRYFRLTLPAAAVDMADFFRFQIPVRMIEGFGAGEANGEG